METFLALAGVLAALAAGVVSPGPAFVFVSQTAVSQSRRAGLAAALGMGLGAMALSIAALLGLQALLQQFPRAAWALRVGGAAYLMWFAWGMWKGARMPLAAGTSAPVEAPPLRRAAAAFGVMVTNPKAAVQYGVILGAFMPRQASHAFALLLPLGVFVLEFGWYALVALALSAPGPRAAYLGAKGSVDRIAGAVLAGLGLKLLLSR